MTSRIKEDLKEIAYTFPESFYDDGDDDIEYDDDDRNTFHFSVWIEVGCTLL